MFETELKFQVPPESRAALLRAVATVTAVTTRLQAVYADTADRHLAAAGLALRLRKEGRFWVQTLKGRGDGLMQRQEHEVQRGAGAAIPALNAQLHAGTPVGDRLLALLVSLGQGSVLQPVYRTDIRRLHRRVRHGGALIELAYDRGFVIAGEQQAPVDEIEFELIRGPDAALIDLGQRWSLRFGLWWDVRTKSERGCRMALGLERVDAVMAELSAFKPDTPPAQAWAQMLAAALRQALNNAAEIASGSGDPEHLHQLRVALRRLRTALRDFAPWSAAPEAALALEVDWREPFGQLGAVRDSDVLSHTLQPALEAAGAPLLPPLQAGQTVDLGGFVRDAAFNTLLLRTLALCQEPAAAAARLPDAKALVQPLWLRIKRELRTFAQASTEDQHRLRKRTKRLRYALEAVQPLLKRKAGERFLGALRHALQALGDLNDLYVAQALYRQQAQGQPQAWFAVGYLAARQQAQLQEVARVLARLHELKLPWR